MLVGADVSQTHINRTAKGHQSVTICLKTPSNIRSTLEETKIKNVYTESAAVRAEFS